MAKKDTGTISPEAKVFITLIEVGNTPNNLGEQITRGRNTQNAVQGLHFAASVPIRSACVRSWPFRVLFTTTVHRRRQQGGPDQFRFEQAALALACFSGDTKTVIAAKKEIGQIYDPLGEFYPKLFTQNLSGLYLCRAVRILII